MKNFKCYLNKCLILLGFLALDFLTYHSLTTHFSLHKIRYSFHLIRQRTFSYMAVQIHRHL